MRRSGLSATTRNWHEEEGPVYSFFGATPDSWIGKLWPRGRAWQNGLSTATLEDNFCNRWSGGLNFLRHAVQRLGSIRSSPTARCIRAASRPELPIGSLLEDEPHRHPGVARAACRRTRRSRRAIPERMGLAYGWSEEEFIAQCAHDHAAGTPYRNLCIGCDRFHEEVLGPVLDEARERRRAARTPTGLSRESARGVKVSEVRSRGPSHWRPRSPRCAARAQERSGTRSPRRRGPDRELQRVGRRREDQCVHRSGPATRSRSAMASRSTTSSSRTRRKPSRASSRRRPRAATAAARSISSGSTAPTSWR